jgi:hypothetical protein
LVALRLFFVCGFPVSSPFDFVVFGFHKHNSLPSFHVAVRLYFLYRARFRRHEDRILDCRRFDMSFYEFHKNTYDADFSVLLLFISRFDGQK